MSHTPSHNVGGYVVHKGPEPLFRVPDLLNEKQFVRYMKDMYDVDVVFLHDETNVTAVDEPTDEELFSEDHELEE